MGFNISGLNDLAKEFQGLSQKAQELEGEYEFKDIFTTRFMQQHTSTSSIYEFFDEHQVPTSQQEFESFPDAQLDKIVRENTDFQSWDSMYETALSEFVESKLRP